MWKTKIINDTTFDFDIKEGNAGVFVRLNVTLRSKGEYTFNVDPNTTYREYAFVNPVDHFWISISSDDLGEAEEITIYEWSKHTKGFRISKARGKFRQLQRSTQVKDLVAFDAVRKDASSRIEMIETSRASVEKLLKQVKTCPAQCKNLVQTCLKGTNQMIETYFAVSANDMWQLYYSKKLPHLISSLDRLLSTLESVEDLLQVCGSQWYKMGLVLSIPLPPPEKKAFSKFDLLIKELNWNLDSIHYVLDLTKDLFLKWNDNRCRYVLEGNQGTGVAAAGVMEPAESERLVREDRAHFLSHLEDGSILSSENCILQWARNFVLLCAEDELRDYCATDGLHDSFAAILKKRLQDISVLPSECSAVPNCFWIDHADLKTRNKLSGDLESNAKAIYKGEWCGQVVAIRIMKGTTKAAVEREAVVMLKVQHPNIVDFRGCGFTDNAPQPVSGGSDEKCAVGYLVMELMEEDLRHVIDRLVRNQFGSPFPIAVAVDILLQIVGAMIHMHNCGIMYRDLKAANCLVNSRPSLESSSQVLDLYTVKLIDFETSKMFNPDDAISNHTVNAGTCRWMAPEVFYGSGVYGEAPYTRSADVYSFGMTCYEIITGLLPFHECVFNREILVALREGKRPLLPASVSCPEGLKEIMSKCWAQDPMNRPDFKEIQKDLWTIKYELELQ